MSVLLEAYRRTIGDEDKVKKQGNGHNGPCPFCGGSEKARSDRFVVWDTRTENLGETCASNNVPGVWYCRGCGKSGDTIAFLMEAEGMTFKSACAELGITTTARRAPSRRTPQPPSLPREESTLQEWPIKAQDPVKWQEYATKLHAESREMLHTNPHALRWLAERGLDETAVDRYQLGYLPGEGDKTGRTRARSGLGLAPKEGRDGKVKTAIFIPRGIVIPHFDTMGRILRLRIRRPKPDVAAFGAKYMVLEGSSSQPMLLESSRPTHLAAYVTIEAELDGMLVHHLTNQEVGAFAALTNRGKPDKHQHPILRDAAVNLLAQDFDPREVTRPDGSVVTETPGGEGATWWTATYTNAKRWPVPFTKDPGDAFSEGLDIRAWIIAGLPPSIALTEPHRDSVADTGVTGNNNATNGAMEPFSTGLSHVGDGGTAKDAPLSSHASGKTHLNLPVYLREEDVPAAVLGLYGAWAGIPAFAVAKRNDGGAFSCDDSWARATEENWAAVRDLQARIFQEKELWDWIFTINQNPNVTIENLLHIYG